MALILLAPGGALAALTARVDGFEPALNQAWSAKDECRTWLVDDLLVRSEAFVLTTTTPTLLRIVPGAAGGAVCSSNGWSVSVAAGSTTAPDKCVQAVCEVLHSSPELPTAMRETLARERESPREATVPIHWAPPSLEGIGRVWFASCVGVLLLLVTLPLIRRRLLLSGPSSTLSRSDWTVLLVIALAGLALRAWLAWHLSIELDEEVSAGYDSLWREFDGRETAMNPPLYRVLSLPLSYWTGGDPRTGRVIPVVIGAALILVMARLGGLMAGRYAALTAGFLTAFHPGLTLATMYHRSYASLLLASALSILAIETALRTGRRLDRYFAAVCLSAAVLSHYFGVAVVFGSSLWILVAERRRWSWLGPLALLVVLCVPFVPAALSGAHIKAPSANVRTGTAHARELALSSPSVVSGAIAPMLQEDLFPDYEPVSLVLMAVVLVVVLALSATRLPWRTSFGLLAILVVCTLLPVIFAMRLTTIREFQVIAAAIPLIVLLSALVAWAARSKIRAAVPVAVGGLAIAYVAQLPLESLPPSELDQAVESIRSQPARWPIHVWTLSTPAYQRVAVRAGLKRKDIDLSTDGRDARVRRLRSCSTAAVRDAAELSEKHEVSILVFNDRCSQEMLSGRGVPCSELQKHAELVTVISCKVSPDVVRRPLPAPRRELRRAERAIPAGLESVFVGAAGAMQGARPDARGIVLEGITVQETLATYRLRGPSSEAVVLHLSPHFEGAEITGSDIVLEPAEAELPANVLESARSLRGALLSTFTAERWNAVYGRILHGTIRGDVMHARPWLVAQGLALVILLAVLMWEEWRARVAASTR